MWMLLFLRFLPALSIAEIKEILPPPIRRQPEDAGGHPPLQLAGEELPTGYRELEHR
jgi:hypothetical protein